MRKFNTGVPEPRLSQLVDYKRRFPRTAARRFPTSDGFAETRVGGSSASDPARGNAAVTSGKPATLTVQDIMSVNVISVSPNTPVREVAEILSQNRISSVPVVDGADRLLGLVGDSDLLRRVEIGTEPRRSWWQVFFYDAMAASHDYVRSHGRKARDVMTLHPHTAAADEPLDKVAKRMARKRLRGMPVVHDERVVGMLSRTDLVRLLASRSAENVVSPNSNDDVIRERLMATIDSLPWNMRVRVINATVEKGIVHMYGWIATEVERRALHVVAENTPGVSEVHDHLRRARLHM
jgi:CBS domain-containing protein